MTISCTGPMIAPGLGAKLRPPGARSGVGRETARVYSYIAFR